MATAKKIKVEKHYLRHFYVESCNLVSLKKVVIIELP